MITALVVNKCFFELVFVSQYLWINFADESFFWQDSDICTPNKDDDKTCSATVVAGFLSCVTQFSFLGNELYFLVITMDLHLACTNPFTSYKLNAQRYMIFVFGSSFTTAVLLGLLGDNVYGLSSDASVWIQVP